MQQEAIAWRELGDAGKFSADSEHLVGQRSPVRKRSAVTCDRISLTHSFVSAFMPTFQPSLHGKAKFQSLTSAFIGTLNISLEESLNQSNLVGLMHSK